MKTWVEKNCRNCCSKFMVERSQCKPIKRKYTHKIYTGGKYCSRICFTRYFQKYFKPTLGKTWKHTKEYKKKLSESRLGEKNPMYIHGKYGGKKRRGKTQRQKLWRRKVFKRDDYKCRICKKRGGNLEAHHVKIWALHKKERYLINNGVTLCQRHHKVIHDIVRGILKKYGSKTNSKIS